MNHCITFSLRIFHFSLTVTSLTIFKLMRFMEANFKTKLGKVGSIHLRKIVISISSTLLHVKSTDLLCREPRDLSH